MLENTQIFINKARKIHGNKFDYSKVDYITSNTKVEIICKKHGSFYQNPGSHIQAQGCPICGKLKCRLSKRKHLNSKSFIKRANKIHNNKYNYSKIGMIDKGIHQKIHIICEEHGTFHQVINNHLNAKSGCPKCGDEISGRRLSKEEFLERANNTHNNSYDYSKIKYSRASRSKIEIICNKHGSFWMKGDTHYNGRGCPRCGKSISSSGERQILEYIETIYSGEIVLNSRRIIAPKEIDIYIPEFNLAIEFNGLYWHTEEFLKGKEYHYNKFRGCEKQGIELISIYSDEWVDNPEAIKNIIKSKLSKPSIKNSEFFIENVNKLGTRENISDNRWGNGSEYLLLGYELGEDLEPDFDYVKGRDRLSMDEFGDGLFKIWDCGGKLLSVK